ncbi:unnamed protein product [Caenorhabditis sp. 36 PRJEB53466]|nr:unnamed protein product [Caenorhabditis sp. 36 PRJEB53466]
MVPVTDTIQEEPSLPQTPVSDVSLSSVNSSANSPALPEEVIPGTPAIDSSESAASSPQLSPQLDSDGKTVAMSVGGPRLSINGKRIGRPPGTFKVQRHRDDVRTKESKKLQKTVCKWDFCNMVFPSIAAIAAHVQDTHLQTLSHNVKETVCQWEECRRQQFKSFYMLVAHLRTHTGERPMKCTYPNCSKAYKTKENLTTHVRSHTGEKPFKCQFKDCNKRFSNASDRGKHENRCHVTLNILADGSVIKLRRLYLCNLYGCLKSYTDPSSLRKHTINVHGREAQKNRKKVRVPWTIRRDGDVRHGLRALQGLQGMQGFQVIGDLPIIEIGPHTPIRVLANAPKTMAVEPMECEEKKEATEKLILPKMKGLREESGPSAFRMVPPRAELFKETGDSTFIPPLLQNGNALDLITFLNNQALMQCSSSISGMGMAALPIIPPKMSTFLNRQTVPPTHQRSPMMMGMNGLVELPQLAPRIITDLNLL